MNIILLSGGSGQRLWPLSNESRSKQFLKVLVDENGNKESMVQRVYRQIKHNIKDANIVVATSISQVDSIRHQLQDNVDIVIEPSRRNTYPAIALACSYLYFNKGVSEDDAVIVIPVDPYAEDSYFDSLNIMKSVVENNEAEIALMGIKPTYNSSKYGYIIPDMKIRENVYSVKRFQENHMKSWLKN